MWLMQKDFNYSIFKRKEFLNALSTLVFLDDESCCIFSFERLALSRLSYYLEETRRVNNNRLWLNMFDSDPIEIISTQFTTTNIQK